MDNEEISKIALQALIQSTVALAAISSLKDFVFESDEQKDKYLRVCKERLNKSLEKLSNTTPSETLEILDGCVKALKEEFLL